MVERPDLNLLLIGRYSRKKNRKNGKPKIHPPPLRDIVFLYGGRLNCQSFSLSRHACDMLSCHFLWTRSHILWVPCLILREPPFILVSHFHILFQSFIFYISFTRFQIQVAVITFWDFWLHQWEQLYGQESYIHNPMWEIMWYRVKSMCCIRRFINNN